MFHYLLRLFAERQYGYDVDKIIAEFSALDFLKRQLQFCKRIISALK